MELRLRMKILFLVLAACIIFPAVLNGIQAARNHNHGCQAHDYITSSCIDCHQIKTARNFLKIFQLTNIGFFLAVLLVYFAQILEKYLNSILYPLTPVMQKIRFNT